MILIRLLLVSVCLSVCLVGRTQGGDWWAQPLVVHEWGVHLFNWQGNAIISESLPAFMYTDAKPGTPIPVKERVKDLPPESGFRFKPILYFYSPGYPISPGIDVSTPVTPVGVEVRFSQGYASAWWPQVSIYRTPAQTAQAVPIDWAEWQRIHAHDSRRSPRPKVPDDERFELVWHNLTLSDRQPPLPMAGDDLPETHWVKRARQVNSLFVSNGKEAEKYLFYEGKTTEKPTIAIVPTEVPKMTQYHLVNVGDISIYDVFVIYRDRGRGVLWTGYLAELPPIRKCANSTSDALYALSSKVLPQMTALALPDFATLPDKSTLDVATFNARTRDRLLESLTAGEYFTGDFFSGLHDPADFQPPTTSAQLFPDEARAIETIWHDDFFEADGLTILYREAPAYLDQAMPLWLFTDKYHYIKLSRCGLVLNQHVPFAQVKAVNDAVRGSALDVEKREEYLNVCRQNRFLALGLARYYAAVLPTVGSDYIDPNTKAKTHSDTPWYPWLAKMLGEDWWVTQPTAKK